MKFKKIAKVLLSCLMAGALFTGCGGGDKPADTSSSSSSGDIKLGMITRLNATEKRMEEILQMVQEDSGVKLSKYAITYYESLSTMQMGIESGSVDQISLYSSIGKYLTENNDKFEVVSDDSTLNTLTDNFCFAVRAEDTALKAELDKVIGEMKSDGSLDKLVADYITNVDLKNPPKVEIPMTEGADTIKVGVTGDLPPLDFINADNSPAGFNTALLAEVAKRLNKNIECVSITSGSRASALTAKNIDVVFWVVVPTLDKVPADLDKPEGVEVSAPYFKDNVEHLQLKK